MSRNFVIPLLIYPIDVMVSLGQKDCELKKSLQKINFEWNEKMKCEGIGKFFMNYDNQVLLRLQVYPESPSDFGSLQHEIFHGVINVMHFVGMKLKINISDEAYAYLIGYVTTEIYKKIKITI